MEEKYKADGVGGKKGHTGTNTDYHILEVVRCKQIKDLAFSEIVPSREGLGGRDQCSIFEEPLKLFAV
jgi:hypothetical protein